MIDGSATPRLSSYLRAAVAFGQCDNTHVATAAVQVAGGTRNTAQYTEAVRYTQKMGQVYV